MNLHFISAWLIQFTFDVKGPLHKKSRSIIFTGHWGVTLFKTS